jgi:hypothetical protein
MANIEDEDFPDLQRAIELSLQLQDHIISREKEALLQVTTEFVGELGSQYDPPALEVAGLRGVSISDVFPEHFEKVEPKGV